MGIALEQRLAKAAELVDLALRASTGLQDRERKLVTYWTLATHMLPHVNVFPLLVLRGKMGPGKSETLNTIAKLAYQPHPFNLRGNTLSVIRDALVASHQDAAIAEEADQGWKDELSFERLVSDRYHRQSAQTGKMEKSGDNWMSTTKHTCGATVLHRRTPFNDAALDGRSIAIRFRFDATRQYTEVGDDLPWIVEGSELMKGFVFAPVAIDQPQGVAPRIFNTYRPLFVIGSCVGTKASHS